MRFHTFTYYSHFVFVVYIVVLVAPAKTHTCVRQQLIWHHHLPAQKAVSVNLWRKTSDVSLSKAPESVSIHSCLRGRNTANCRAIFPRVGWCNWKMNTCNVQLAAILCRRSTSRASTFFLTCSKGWPVKKACRFLDGQGCKP